MADDELVRRAKALLDRLCETPRFAGSAGEAAARDTCKRELQNAGFDCRERPFEYSEWPGRWGPPLSAAIQAATIVIVARMAMVRGSLTALIIGAAIAAALFFVDAQAKRRWITDFPAQRARSVNLEAQRGTPRVWLVAHLDSKSQTLPMLLRIAGSIALAIAMSIALILLLLDLIGVGAVQSLWPALQRAAILAAVPGITCFVINDGDGAVDNASGVVAVILAGQAATAPSDLGILITSGEELGLAGARAWSISASQDGGFLNCDTVDDEGKWHCMYTGREPLAITNSARRVASRLGMGLRVGRLIPGILADSIAFADRGMTAITVSRGTLSTLARIHTRRDYSNALTGKGAAEASVLLSALAKELA
jgi:hypothetical protein